MANANKESIMEDRLQSVRAVMNCRSKRHTKDNEKSGQMSLMCAIIINSDNCCPGEGRHHEYKDGGQFKANLNQANNRQVDRL